MDNIEHHTTNPPSAVEGALPASHCTTTTRPSTDGRIGNIGCRNGDQASRERHRGPWQTREQQGQISTTNGQQSQTEPNHTLPEEQHLRPKQSSHSDKRPSTVDGMRKPNWGRGFGHDIKEKQGSPQIDTRPSTADLMLMAATNGWKDGASYFKAEREYQVRNRHDVHV